MDNNQVNKSKKQKFSSSLLFKIATFIVLTPIYFFLMALAIALLCCISYGSESFNVSGIFGFLIGIFAAPVLAFKHAKNIDKTSLADNKLFVGAISIGSLLFSFFMLYKKTMAELTYSYKFHFEEPYVNIISSLIAIIIMFLFIVIISKFSKNKNKNETEPSNELNENNSRSLEDIDKNETDNNI